MHVRWLINKSFISNQQIVPILTIRSGSNNSDYYYYYHCYGYDYEYDYDYDYYKMETIFMNTENSKTNEPHRFRLDLTDKLNLKNPKKKIRL